MKEKLNWQSQAIVDIFDEVTLWSAPFGRLLLDNIPMHSNAKVLDIGFGTGFPLIELSQRFGDDSIIYGIDIWKQGIQKTKEKINILSIKNIQIFEQSATTIPLPNEHIDLITSNLGVNNFEDKEEVIQESYRVLKQRGSICITTNPIGTFNELFTLFYSIFSEFDLAESIDLLTTYINNRATKKNIIKLFEQHQFRCNKAVEDTTTMRFVNAKAVLNHSLIRIGFIEGWEHLIPQEQQAFFFKRIEINIQQIIDETGEFVLTIPMLYFEFVKD